MSNDLNSVQHIVNALAELYRGYNLAKNEWNVFKINSKDIRNKE